MSNVKDNLRSMFDSLETHLSAKTVVGEAVHIGDIILVPLIEITFGMGTGLTDKKEAQKTSGGGAMGAKMTPVAILTIIDNTVQLVNVKNQESVNKVIDMIPGLITKLNLTDLLTKRSKRAQEASDVIKEAFETANAEAAAKAEKEAAEAGAETEAKTENE